MTINIREVFPDYVDVASPSYILGTPRNDSVPSAHDGTPWEDRIIKDLMGAFFRTIRLGAMSAAGLVEGVDDEATIAIAIAAYISGNPESATASDAYNAIHDELGLNRLNLESLGGTVLEVSHRHTPDHRVGLLQTTVGTTNFRSVTAGGCRNVLDDADLTLPATMEKENDVAWSQGDQGGLTPTALINTVGKLDLFLVENTLGEVDLCADTSPTAATFFADATAIAADFTDSDLYQRIGSVFTTAITFNLEPWDADANNPKRYMYDIPREAWSAVLPWPGLTVLDLSLFVPPHAEIIMATYGDWTANGDLEYLHPSRVQSQELVGVRFHSYAVGSLHTSSIYGKHRVGDTGQISVRTSDTTNTEAQGIAHGYVDIF